MADNPMIRRYFRREADELTVHLKSYPPLLAVTAYRLFDRLVGDPQVSVDRITNFSDDWRDPVETSIRWASCAVGHKEKEQLRVEATAFVVHRGLGDLKLVVSLGESQMGDDTILQLLIRAEDRDRLGSLVDWIEALEERHHPMRGKLVSLSKSQLSFLPPQGVARDDVILPEAALDEIERNFAFLEDPEGYPRPLRHRAVLLAGPPGVGKTMLAKWLSCRYTSTVLWATPGAVWGVGAATIFGLCRRLRPALLILEDLDVAAGNRGGDQPLGDLLGQLDGFVDLTDIAILGTTNHPEALDKALDPENRPGRFHRLVNIGTPDEKARERLLGRLWAGSEVLGAVDQELLGSLVAGTDGYTGARLAELVHELEMRLLWQRRRGMEGDLAAVLDAVRREAGNGAGRFGFAA